MNLEHNEHLDTTYQHENLAEKASDLFEVLSGKLIKLNTKENKEGDVNEDQDDLEYNQAA